MSGSAGSLSAGAFTFDASVATSGASEWTITTRSSGYFTPFGVQLSSHAIRIFTGDG